MRTSTHAALAILLAALSTAERAAAQPMDTYGMGSRSVALGGAVTADVEDYSANYYNPAGLVRDGRMQIGVGWFGAAHDLSLNDQASNVDPVHGTLIGLVIPGRVDDFRFGFGLGVHLNDQRVSRTRTLPRARPRWEFYDNRPHRAYLSTHLAIQPVEWLRIGGGIAFLSYSANTLTIRGELDALAPDRGSSLEHEILGELTTIRYPQVGVQVQPLPNLNLGVTYRGEYALDNTLVAEVGSSDPDSPNGAVIVAGNIAINGYFFLLTQSVNAYVPHQIAFGASYEPIPEVRIGVDVTWLMWSLYQSPIGRSQVILDIDVPPELEDTIMIPEGGIPEQMPVPANFSDRVVPRIGIEVEAYRNTDLVFDVRAGYFYENSPAPAQMAATNLVDTDRHTWSLGAGLDLLSLRPFLPGWLSLDVHLGYSWLPDRAMEKTSPIDPVGDYVARGHIVMGGFSVEAGFE